MPRDSRVDRLLDGVAVSTTDETVLMFEAALDGQDFACSPL